MLVRRRAICASAEDEVRGMTEEFVRVAMETAAHHARRIARTLRLGREDVADLRQELLLEVLRRAIVFDQSRAAWTTFVSMIIRHAADDPADRFACLRRQSGCSLEELVRTRDGARVRRRELLSEADGLGGSGRAITIRMEKSSNGSTSRDLSTACQTA
jgi:DNA-directed RNA polymerase specialized sigma24 family protein